METGSNEWNKEKEIMEQCSQGADRIFDIIEFIANNKDGAGVTEIANSVSLPKSTVHRTLTSLVCRNYISKDLVTDKYKLGFKLIIIAGQYINQLDLRTAFGPYVHQLSSELNVTAHIAILRDNMAVYIEKVQPYSFGCMYSQIGKTIDLYCSALGKALLLGYLPEDYKKYLDNTEFVKTTPTTPSRSDLEKEISIARNTHITFDNEEHEKGVFCLGVPIYDYKNQVIAAISISSMSKTVITEKNYYDKLYETAKAISNLFGGFKNY